MSTQTMNRLRSGEICTRAGRYSFDGYLDGSWQPEPKADEMAVRLSAGERFPQIPTAGKPCWWVIVEPAASAQEEIQRMIAEGGPPVRAN